MMEKPSGAVLVIHTGYGSRCSLLHDCGIQVTRAMAFAVAPSGGGSTGRSSAVPIDGVDHPDAAPTLREAKCFLDQVRSASRCARKGAPKLSAKSSSRMRSLASCLAMHRPSLPDPLSRNRASIATRIEVLRVAEGDPVSWLSLSAFRSRLQRGPAIRCKCFAQRWKQDIRSPCATILRDLLCPLFLLARRMLRTWNAIYS